MSHHSCLSCCWKLYFLSSTEFSDVMQSGYTGGSILYIGSSLLGKSKAMAWTVCLKLCSMDNIRLRIPRKLYLPQIYAKSQGNGAWKLLFSSPGDYTEAVDAEDFFLRWKSRNHLKQNSAWGRTAERVAWQARATVSNGSYLFLQPSMSDSLFSSYDKLVEFLKRLYKSKE